MNQIIGGWNTSGVLRIQSGRPFYLTSGRQTFNNRDAGVVLNGVTEEELQDLSTVRPGANGNVFFVDERLVGSDGRANPELISSPSTPGELGERVFLYGPGFWNLDIGLAKRFDIGRVWLNFEALFLNALNHPNHLVGSASFLDDGVTVDINSTTFGQTTTDPGSERNIQLRLQLNF